MVSCKLVVVAVAILVILNIIAIAIFLTPVYPGYYIPESEYEPFDWRRNCVLYQINVRSFKDSDGDGIGDLQGVISKLDHLVDAGVNAIVMSPIFVSPMVDFGYDVSEYYDIDPQYGTIDIFDDLLLEAHRRDIRVILDIPVNHASIKSGLFIRSEERDLILEDYFIWADGLIDPENSSSRLPPSNWESQFGGPAWEWSEKRQQYYLHQFSVEQADFNYRNSFLKSGIEVIFEHWLRRGADGVRVGDLPFLIEADPDNEGRYPDNVLGDGLLPSLNNRDHMDLYDVVYDWRQFIDMHFAEEEEERMLIAAAETNLPFTMLYYGDGAKTFGANFPYNFNFITLLSARASAWHWVDAANLWLTNMPTRAIPNWMLGNHDHSRVASRFRDNLVDGLNAFIMFLPGVAVTYQGEELGMRDGFVSWEDTKDARALSRGDSEHYQHYSRDPARTPYHWDESTSAGFSTNETTWLPVANDYTEINLAKQKLDAKSHFKVYQALTALRKEPTLFLGGPDNLSLRTISNRAFICVRTLSWHDTFTLIFNISDFFETVNLSSFWELRLPATIYVSSSHSWRNSGDSIVDESLILAPGEAIILRSRPWS